MILESYLDVHPRLVEQVLADSKVRPSVKASSRGGYHSEPYLKSPNWFLPALEIVEARAGTKVYNFWFNINGPGHYNAWHKHGLGFSSLAVWYLQTPPNSGCLEIRVGNEIKTIEPSQGLFVLHPCGLEHRVTENLSTDLRISVAFNFV